MGTEQFRASFVGRLARVFSILILASQVGGQDLPVETTPRFLALFSTTGTTARLTLQLAANSSTRVYPRAVNVFCGIACTLAQRKNGTTAAATSVSAIPLTTVGATAVATAWHTTGSTGGSSLNDLSVPAAVEYPISLEHMLMPAGQSSVQNYTIDLTAGSSTTLRIAIIWAERR